MSKSKKPSNFIFVLNQTKTHMSSIPQFYTHDFTTTTSMFPNNFCELPLPTAVGGGGGGGGGINSGPLWGEETLVPMFDDFGLHNQQPCGQYSSEKLGLSCAIDPTPFPHQEMIPLPELSNMASMCAINNAAVGCQSCCTIGCQPDHTLFEFQDNCFGLVPDIKPLYHLLPPDNWEIQSNQVPVSEESNMKVSRYSEEVRKEKIVRYLKKRNQRNFNKTIKYACRKTLADRRIRVRGRFARNNEACDQELNPTNNNDTNSIHKDTQLLYTHDHGRVQMKKDEEEWLQEITSLMYLPYINS